MIYDMVPDHGQRRRPFAWQQRVQLGGANAYLLDNIHGVAEFLRKLTAEIGMERHGDPIVDRFGVGDLYGVTGIQPITTSSIVVHADGPTAYLDVCSCRRFDPRIAAEFAIDWFGASSARSDFTRLQAPAPGAGIVLDHTERGTRS